MKYRHHLEHFFTLLLFGLVVLVNIGTAQVPDLTGTWNVTVTGVNGADEFRWELIKENGGVTSDLRTWAITRTLVKTANFAKQPLIGQSERGGSIEYKEGKFYYKQGTGLFVQAATCSVSGDTLACDQGTETIGLANGREFPLTIKGKLAGGPVSIPPPLPLPTPTPPPPLPSPSPSPTTDEVKPAENVISENPPTPATTPKTPGDEAIRPTTPSHGAGAVGPAALAVVGSTAADGTFLGTIPSVGGTVLSFRFFTTNEDIPPPQGMRQYQTRFSRATLGMVYYEFSVKYVTENAANYSMASTWSRGTVPLVRQELPVAKPANWNTSTRSYGHGSKDQGKWEPGTYTVKVEVEGRKVAEGSFVVY